MNMHTEAQKAYTAGVLDGEGSISIAINRTAKYRKINYVVRIGNTNLEMLKMIQQWFGGFISQDKKPDPRRRHAMYRLIFVSLKADRLLEEILPYLIVKKGKAQAFIKLRRMRRESYAKHKEVWKRDAITGRYIHAGGILYTQEELAILNSFQTREVK